MQSRLISWRLVFALTLAIFSFANASMAQAVQPAPDAIIGKWAADDGSSQLEMFKSGDEYRARLLYGNKLLEADGVTMRNDIKNPDPALRYRSLKNIVFATGLRYAKGEWKDGSIYDAASGGTYQCQASIEYDKLRLRGYVAIP